MEFRIQRIEKPSSQSRPNVLKSMTATQIEAMTTLELSHLHAHALLFFKNHFLGTRVLFNWFHFDQMCFFVGVVFNFYFSNNFQN